MVVKLWLVWFYVRLEALINLLLDVLHDITSKLKKNSTFVYMHKLVSTTPIRLLFI